MPTVQFILLFSILGAEKAEAELQKSSTWTNKKEAIRRIWSLWPMAALKIRPRQTPRPTDWTTVDILDNGTEKKII